MNYTSKLKIIPIVIATIFFLKISSQLQATPYASGITNNAGLVSFILNENADNVKIVFDGGGAGNTNDMGVLLKGSQSFSLGAHSSYAILVTKTAAVGWTLTSDDLNPLVRFYDAKGIAVFNSPADLSRFGRIYIANTQNGTVTDPPAASARTVGTGIYMLNADQSDALGYGNTAQTGGINYDVSSNSPFKVEVGEDNLLYIADYSDPVGTIYRSDADVTSASGEVVLSGIGSAANATVHTDIEGSVFTKGSLTAGNLQVWAIDGNFGGTGNKNRLMRWDINSGPLPYNTPPTLLGTAGNTGTEVQSDLSVAPDGKFFLCQNRQFNTPTYDVNRVNIRVYDTDGTTLLWDSFQQSIAAGLTNATTGDVFVGARAISVSPDGKRMAVIRNDVQTWIVNLVNGLPVISTRLLLNGFGATSTSTTLNGRDVSWDIAGNLYMCNQNHEKLRVWSPGGSSTAITTSAGTFQIVVPATIVSVTNSVATANEQGPVHGQFTLTRSGDVSAPLTVNYTVSGTATPGSDYTALPGSVTFAANALSTNIPVTVTDDASAELTETVILTITGNGNFGINVGSATVSILDNETPEVSFVPVAQKQLLEGYATSKVIYQLVRRGLLTTPLTVNLSYSGTATLGVDYNAQPTISMGANVVNANVTLSSINDQNYEGDETATITVNSGTGYGIGTPASISATVVDDETPAGTVLFHDEFETDSSASWVVNKSNATDAFAEFGWDYGVNAGIPPAPGSSTTKGLRFRCGNTILITDAVSASPLNGNFTGDYRLKFNMWINYNGPLPDGGAGSTQNFDAGVGTTGDHVVWENSPDSDGIWFDTTGDGADGNIGGDYNAYLGNAKVDDDSGVYAAGVGTPSSGIRNSTNSFYSLWGGVSAPAAQLTLYPGQTGVADTGNAGMAWHSVVIAKISDTVTWIIDGITIATVTNTGSFSTNIFVGYQDIFATGNLSDKPEMSFGLVDNLRVETLSAPATPIITQIEDLGSSVRITFTAGASDLPGSFSLLQAALVTDTFVDTGLTPTSPSAGVFQVTVTKSGNTHFYRIKR